MLNYFRIILRQFLDRALWLGKARGTRKIPQNLDISQNKYELFFRVKMDPSVKTSIEKRLIESGEKERLKVLIDNPIIQCTG